GNGSRGVRLCLGRFVLTLVGLTKGEVLERLIVARGDTSGHFLWMLSGGDSLKLLEKRVRE
ncbi:hypothetical protein BBG01_01815, partial [Streptococcus dysgalactiae subsp. equisimilis]